MSRANSSESPAAIRWALVRSSPRAETCSGEDFTLTPARDLESNQYALDVTSEGGVPAVTVRARPLLQNGSPQSPGGSERSPAMLTEELLQRLQQHQAIPWFVEVLVRFLQHQQLVVPAGSFQGLVHALTLRPLDTPVPPAVHQQRRRSILRHPDG